MSRSQCGDTKIHSSIGRTLLPTCCLDFGLLCIPDCQEGLQCQQPYCWVGPALSCLQLPQGVDAPARLRPVCLKAACMCWWDAIQWWNER